jgi:hypothetical protein
VLPAKPGAFSGGLLFQSETDGSSFPNGGLRATHTAAAYMSWDRLSPPFVRGDTVYIPSSFITWTGAAEDEKTPLLRSMEAISSEGTRVMKAIGTECTEVVCNVGWEQEFFCIDVEHYLQRPDLMAAGRALIGAQPARGQQTDFNYFNTTQPRVAAFLDEVQSELWAIGQPLSVMHNEVRSSFLLFPSLFLFVLIYSFLLHPRFFSLDTPGRAVAVRVLAYLLAHQHRERPERRVDGGPSGGRHAPRARGALAREALCGSERQREAQQLGPQHRRG